MFEAEEIEDFKTLRWKKFAPQVFGFGFLVVVMYSLISIYLAKDSWSMSPLDSFIIVLFSTFPITVPLFAYCFIYFYRLIDNLGDPDFDHYMLYLRPFFDDENVIEENEIRDAFGTQWPLLSSLSGSSPNFDVFISRAFSDTKYTTVSLGDPKDFMPKPGTKKLYPRNEDWKEYVLRLIDNAEAVLFRCSDTENFRWELNYLINNRFLERSFLYVGLEKSELQVWKSVSKVLKESGIAVPTKFPGFGSTIAFSCNNKAFILTKCASNPRVFREKILSQLKVVSELGG